MRIAVVLNTSAGSLVGQDGAANDVAGLLTAAGYDALIEPDDGRSIAQRIEAAIGRPGADAVVVGGGDGTIACAAQRLAGTGMALGLLPLGTMNLLAKDLGVPTVIGQAVANLAQGSVREIDVGEVNGRVFLIKSVLGMPAKMARHRESKRGAMTLAHRIGFMVAILRHLYRCPPRSVALDIDGQRRRIRTRALAVVNNDYGEGFGQLFMRSSVDRGRLTVYVARNLSAWRMLRMGVGMAIGSWRNTPGLERYETDGLTIASPRRTLRVMNDGEVHLLTPPLIYSMRPKALRVIVPRPSAAPTAILTAQEAPA